MLIQDEYSNMQVYAKDGWWHDSINGEFKLDYKTKASRMDRTATQIEMVKKVDPTIKHIVTQTPTNNPQSADMNYIPFKAGTRSNGGFRGWQHHS